jgi:hypothetical protein
MFNPKAQAQGALMQAHSNYYGNAAQNASAQARLHAAEAAGIEDQNNAYADSVLADAGYTPMQRAAIRAARSKSVADIFKGVNENTGAQYLINANGDANQIQTGLALTGQGSTAYGSNFAPNSDVATANKIAVEQGKPVNVPLGNTIVTLNPDGSATPRYESNINVAPGHTIVSPTSTGVSTLFKSDVPSGNVADPLRAAETSLALQDKLNKEIIAETSAVDSTGKNYVNQPTADQVRSISAYAVKLIEGGMSPQDAKNQSALAHGVKLNPQSVVAETTPGRLWGENNTGRYLLKGFHPPVAETPATSNLSNTVVPAVPAQIVTAPAAAPAPATQSAPAVIKATTQAQIDNAPSGAIIEVNGKRFRKP